MPRLRTLAFGLLGLLILAVGLAWIVPPLLDWSRYRDNIAVLASAVLGRPVSIGGRVSLTLLPEPVLTASDVSVRGAESGPNRAGSAAITGTARELRLRVGLGPLLGGTIAARELVLHRPDIHLAWPLAPGPISFRRPSWLDSISARIEDGTVTIGPPGGPPGNELRCTGIDAAIAAGVESAGASASGTARCDDRTWRFTARATGAGADGAEGIDLALDGQGRLLGLGGSFSGQLAGNGTLSGRIAARGPDLSQLMPAPAVPFRAGGRLTVAAGMAAADDLTLEIGGSPATGAATLRLAPEPRLDISLAASRLDLDAWLPVLLASRPFGWPVAIDLSAEAVQLRGGVLRRLRAGLDVARDATGMGGAVTVRDAAVVLPGEAGLRFAGTLERGGEASRYTGSARLTAPDFRGLLRWLEQAGMAPLARLPPAVLRTAELSAAVAVTRGSLALSDLAGRVDGAAVGGALGVSLGQRVALAGRLTVEPLLLDPWFEGGLPSLAEVPRRFADFDGELSIAAGRVGFRGQAASDFSAEAAISGGRVALRRAAFTSRGVAVQLSGAIEEGGRLADGHLLMQTRDAAPLADLVGDLVPAVPRPTRLWSGPSRVEVQAAGPPQALALRIGLDLADARLEAQPVLDLPAGRWAGPLTLRHPGAPRFLAALGLPGAGWVGDGSLAVVAQMSGAPGRLAAENIELGAGGLHAAGQLAVTQDGPTGRRRLTGSLSAETLPLPALDPRAAEPFPVAGLRDWQVSLALAASHVATPSGPLLDNARATLVAEDDVLALAGLTANPATHGLSGGTVTGEMRVALAANPPVMSVRASLDGAALVEPLSGLPLDLAAGRLGAEMVLQAAGHGPAAMLASLSGDVRIEAREGAVSGFDLSLADDALGHAAPPETVLRQALAGGSTGFDSLALSATLRRGSLRLDQAGMSGPAGSATFAGAIDLAAGAVDLQATLLPAVPDAAQAGASPGGPPTLGVRVSGPWAAPRRLLELADVTRWRASQAVR